MQRLHQRSFRHATCIVGVQNARLHMHGSQFAEVPLAWQAVDKLELRHLVNCLVFPQLGMRSHANETSGGDLDGEHSHIALRLLGIGQHHEEAPALHDMACREDH